MNVEKLLDKISKLDSYYSPEYHIKDGVVTILGCNKTIALLIRLEELNNLYLDYDLNAIFEKTDDDLNLIESVVKNEELKEIEIDLKKFKKFLNFAKLFNDEITVGINKKEIYAFCKSNSNDIIRINLGYSENGKKIKNRYAIDLIEILTNSLTKNDILSFKIGKKEYPLVANVNNTAIFIVCPRITEEYEF